MANSSSSTESDWDTENSSSSDSFDDCGSSDDLSDATSDGSDADSNASSTSDSCGTIAEFKAREGEINHGFDPMHIDGPPKYAPPWASVWSDGTSDVVKLVISPAENAGDVELQIEDGEEFVQVSPTDNFTEGETNLTLLGLGSGEIQKATIHAICKSTGEIIGTLKVMILPLRTITLGIYRVTDSNSEGTAPLDAPSDEDILADLNDVYKQAGIQFTIAVSEDRDVHYDGYVEDPDNPGHGTADLDQINGGFGPDEEIGAFSGHSWAGTFRIAMIKQSSDTTWAGGTISGGALSPGAILVTSFGSVALIAAHEIGHWLELSTRNIVPDDEEGPHDGPPWPEGTEGFMKTRSGAPGRWLRHTDWEQANKSAADHEE